MQTTSSSLTFSQTKHSTRTHTQPTRKNQQTTHTLLFPVSHHRIVQNEQTNTGKGNVLDDASIQVVEISGGRATCLSLLCHQGREPTPHKAGWIVAPLTAETRSNIAHRKMLVWCAGCGCLAWGGERVRCETHLRALSITESRRTPGPRSNRHARNPHNTREMK